MALPILPIPADQMTRQSMLRQMHERMRKHAEHVTSTSNIPRGRSSSSTRVRSDSMDQLLLREHDPD